MLLSSSVLPTTGLRLKLSLSISLQLIAVLNLRVVLILLSAPQVVFFPGSPKVQWCHSCGQISPLVPYGLSSPSYLCPEIIPQWLLGKFKSGVVC